MALQAALLAGKALKFLPYITGGLGAVQGYRQGGIGGGITGGGMGALGGFGLGGPLRGLTAKGIRMAGSPGMVKGAQGLVGRLLQKAVMLHLLLKLFKK